MMDKVAKIEVTFYGRLAKVFQKGKREFDLRNAPNIRILMDVLCPSYEDREKIFKKDSTLRPEIIILRNGRNISLLNGLDTELNPGDSVAIFPPTQGG
jgi:molybdopterin synthase sulfur carrier subunit